MFLGGGWFSYITNRVGRFRICKKLSLLRDTGFSDFVPKGLEDFAAKRLHRTAHGFSPGLRVVRDPP
jgi:hypothetical protein